MSENIKVDFIIVGKADDYMDEHDMWDKVSPLIMTSRDWAVRRLVTTLMRLDILDE